MSSREAEEAFQQLFFTPQGRTDPYPCYERLRASAPIHRSDIGMWVLSGYDDCWAALRDPRFGKAYEKSTESRIGADWREHPSAEVGLRSMININGAPHTRLRKRIAKSFTPRRIDAMGPRIEEIVRDLLEPVLQAGGGDILEAVGFPMPVAVIGELLGVPEPDRAMFRSLVTDFVGILEMKPTPEQVETADRAVLEIHGYFRALLADLRATPGPGILSELIHDGPASDPLSVDELVGLATLLFAAGFETTTNLTGNGLWGLLRNPDQIDLLRADPGLFETLPEELLRYDGSVHLANRVPDCDVEIGDVVIPKGESVFALLGSGNRDPAAFDQPDRLDVTRKDVKPLTFGGGVHFCVGAHLARLEIRTVFRQLIEGFESFELAGAEPVYQDRLTLRGLTSLHIQGRAAGTKGRGATASVAQAGASAAVRPDTNGASAVAGPAAEPADRSTSGPSRPDLSAPGRGLRPAAGSDADFKWREQLRARLETGGIEMGSGPAGSRADQDAVARLFAQDSLFSRCTIDELRELAATAYEISFDPGDMLCVEGAESNECYIVQEGEAIVTVGTKGVGRLTEGAVIGERGVLLETTRAATVTAITHMIAYAIASDRFRAVVAQNPEAKQWMIEEMDRRYPEAAAADRTQ